MDKLLRNAMPLHYQEPAQPLTVPEQNLLRDLDEEVLAGPTEFPGLLKKLEMLDSMPPYQVGVNQAPSSSIDSCPTAPTPNRFRRFIRKRRRMAGIAIAAFAFSSAVLHITDSKVDPVGSWGQDNTEQAYAEANSRLKAAKSKELFKVQFLGYSARQFEVNRQGSTSGFLGLISLRLVNNSKVSSVAANGCIKGSDFDPDGVDNHISFLEGYGSLTVTSLSDPGQQLTFRRAAIWTNGVPSQEGALLPADQASYEFLNRHSCDGYIGILD